MNQTTNHYTFGENDLAAERLAHLAAAYERPSREFLTEWGLANASHAIDLGCGPGFTTQLVESTLCPGLVTGIDASQKLLAQAKRRVPSGAFLLHDVTRSPFPCARANVLYCRFLLTHLSDLGAALRAWAEAAHPGARLLVQETASLESDEPAIHRYYQLVAALQSGYGQAFDVGVDLDRHVEQQGWKIVSSEQRHLEQDPKIMGRLHAMNIRTWSQDAMAQRSFDPEEIASLQSELDRIASGEQRSRPVRNALRQLVAVRR